MDSIILAAVFGVVALAGAVGIVTARRAGVDLARPVAEELDRLHRVGEP